MAARAIGRCRSDPVETGDDLTWEVETWVQLTHAPLAVRPQETHGKGMKM